jgi:tetratricopeptide (TPR) repeat protein
MRWPIYGFLGLATLLAQPTFGASEKDINDCFSGGTEHVRTADVRIASCTRLLNDRNESPRDRSGAYNERGLAWREKGDNDRAIADYSEAIRLEPSNADYLDTRCWTRATAGRDLPQALADCDRALRLKPNYDAPLDSRGLVYLRLGRLDQSIADYDAVLKLVPTNAFSLYGRSLAKLRKGDAAGGNADIAAAKAIQADIADQFARFGVAALDQPAAPVPSSAPAPAADCARAETHWKSAEDMRSLAVYEDHLARFPTCDFAGLARARIEALKK